MKHQEQLDFLSLPHQVVTRLAMVRLDEPEIWPPLGPHGRKESRKSFVFFVLRRGDRRISAAAWTARHYVLRPRLENIVSLGDAEWALKLLRASRVFVDMSWCLKIAARSGKEDCVRMLLLEGADLHYDGDTALFWAAKEGHLGCVRALLEAGADAGARGGRALAAARLEAHAGVVGVLDAVVKAGKRLPGVISGL